MMKVNELMIGDLARVVKGVCFKKGTIVVIRGIDSDRTFHDLKGCATCVAIDDPDEMQCGKWLEYLEPIEITTEFLKKNFEYRGNDIGIFDDYFDFYIRPIQDGIWMLTYSSCEMNIPIESVIVSWVHELQHFLTHCGIDKKLIKED